MTEMTLPQLRVEQHQQLSRSVGRLLSLDAETKGTSHPYHCYPTMNERIKYKMTTILDCRRKAYVIGQDVRFFSQPTTDRRVGGTLCLVSV